MNLPKHTNLTRSRLYLVDNRALPDGSWVHPVNVANAAALDACEMRVTFLDVGVSRAGPAELRDLIAAQRPDEIVWASDRDPLFDGEFTRYKPIAYDKPAFPVLDRWQAERYAIKYAPGFMGWQLQVHALPMGPEWFAAYVADLRNRVPAHTSAVVFGLELCAYQTEAIAILGTLGKPWSCAASSTLLHRVGECMSAGCIGYIVDLDTVDCETIVAAKLRGLLVHALGSNPARALEVPVDSFTPFVLTPAKTEDAA
jgi:hypothetical protein